MIVDKDKLLASLATIRNDCKLAQRETDLYHMRLGIEVAVKNIDRLVEALPDGT